MTRRLLRRGAMCVAALVAALGATVPVAGAGVSQEAPPTPDPILAIVSPLASPVCSTAGTATLLVPILGGLVETTLALDGTVSVGDLILDSLGPIYIVCGTLPESPGTRCLLDDQLAGLVPAEVSDTTGPLPAPLGGLVDAVTATLQLLGLDAAASLQPALQCDVRTPGEAADAPEGADEAPDLPSVAGVASIPPPSIGTSDALGLAPPSAPPPSGPATSGAASTQTLVDLIASSTPGWVRALQVVVAVGLGLFLLASWATSVRVARRMAG